MVQCIYCFLLLLTFLVSSQVLAKHHDRRMKLGGHKIVGGYNTTIQQVPYQVYILLQSGNDYYQCGGSIITNNYVLTAAHCLKGIQKAYIRAGSTQSDSGGMMYESTDSRIHPFYGKNANEYDVGLIKIAEGIKIDNKTTKVVRLSQSYAADGEELIVSGWGTTSENGNTSSTLMAVSVSVVPKKQCSKEYRKRISNTMFCAGQEGKDSCQGDSGGPAVSSNDNTQKGIVSFGIGCARKGYPGVYAEVADTFISGWIYTNTLFS